MGEADLVERLLQDGYWIAGHAFQVRDLLARGEADLAAFLAVFSVRLPAFVLFDIGNRGKSLVVFRRSNVNDRKELLLNEEAALERVRLQVEWQEEPIGYVLDVRCVALGGGLTSASFFHLDRLVPSLDGLFGWRFLAADQVGTFDVHATLPAADDYSFVLEKLERLLDILAVRSELVGGDLRVGFHIQRHGVTTRRRMPYVGPFGGVEEMVAPLTALDRELLEHVITTADERVAAAAAGLN